jgi:hypothetical protein
MKTSWKLAALLFASTVISAPAAFAGDDYAAAAQDFVMNNVAPKLADPVVLDAIKAQDAKNAGLQQADIDALDKQWRAEVEAAAKPMIDAVLSSPLSQYLVAMREGSNGIITEIFVTDAKGLNVGQSDPTSDYWQGDEAKWQKTFAVGPGVVFVDKIEQDESTQQLQTQVSMTISDPASGAAIGAVTVGINVDRL